MRRDRFSRTGSSDDGETTERTGLMRHSSFLGQYPYFGSSSDRFDDPHDSHSTGARVREENMTEYYRQTFTVRGVNIGVRDVTQVRRYRLHRCFPRALAPKVECESVTAYLAAGQLHAIVDADGAAAKALVKTIAGEAPCDSGEIVVGGGLISGRAFRRIVGVVSRSSAAAVPNLDVARNLRFALDMRTRGNRGWKRLMIQSMTAFVGISPHTKARDLNPVEQFGLRLAMELVLDPPVVIAYQPFEGLSFAAHSRTAALLRRVATVLRKTVVVSSTSLKPHLFDVSDTVLLFGGAGRVLYSGPRDDLVQYFNDLRIPRHRPQHNGPDNVGGEDPGDHGTDHRRQLPPTLHSSSGGSGAELSATPRLCPSTYNNNNTNRADDAGDGADADDDPSRFFRTPLRISSRLFSDGEGTPWASMIARKRKVAAPQGSVRVCSGEDAVDLAVEWAESEAQTMYYAAKFYDSPTHQRLIDAISSLANAGDGELPGVVVPHTTEPQRVLWKPVVLLSYFTHQAFAEAELVMGTIGLLVALLIVSLLMHFQPQDQGGMYNIRGILFLLFSIVLITNEATMGSISSQLRHFLHQRDSGLYGTLCFLFCLTIQIVMVRALYLVLLVPFVLTVVQASKGVVAVVGVISVTHALLLYTLYAMVPSRRFAAWAAHAYFGLSLIGSGFLLNLRSMPSFFGSISVIRWGYGPALKERLLGKEFSCDGAGNTSYCYTGEEYLSIEGFTHDSFSFSVLALCMMGTACLAALGFTLAIK